MRKLAHIASIGVFLVVLVPAVAFAHDGNDGHEGHDGGIRAFAHVDLESHFHKRPVNGSVTAVNATGFTMTAADGKVFTVNTANAKLYHPFSTTVIALSDIHVNDKVKVKGTLNGTTIDAMVVVDMPANTHPAKTKATVTAVSGNTVTVQTNHQGIISNVTVKTDANTQITKSDNSAGTMADIAVGAKVKIKGLWDEVLNVLNAIKIKIK